MLVQKYSIYMKKVFIILFGLTILFQPTSSFAAIKFRRGCIVKGSKKIVKSLFGIRDGIVQVINCIKSGSNCTECSEKYSEEIKKDEVIDKEEDEYTNGTELLSL